MEDLEVFEVFFFDILHLLRHPGADIIQVLDRVQPQIFLLLLCWQAAAVVVADVDDKKQQLVKSFYLFFVVRLVELDIWVDK